MHAWQKPFKIQSTCTDRSFWWSLTSSHFRSFSSRRASASSSSSPQSCSPRAARIRSCSCTRERERERERDYQLNERFIILAGRILRPWPTSAQAASLAALLACSSASCTPRSAFSRFSAIFWRSCKVQGRQWYQWKKMIFKINVKKTTKAKGWPLHHRCPFFHMSVVLVVCKFLFGCTSNEQNNGWTIQ